MFNIENRIIGINNPPYIIAELSANHNGSLDRAKLSIKIAKECGVDAIKIQTYNADTMTIDCDRDDFIVKNGLWNGYNLYQLYKEAHTPFEWHNELFNYAREVGITLFSTPFDETAVDLLEDLNTPAYKIASFELCDLPLISYVARKGKPMLMSTGMASIQEIGDAVETAKVNGCNSLLLFHCISSYPAPIDQANLNQITYLQNHFKLPIGLSDHSIGNTCAIAAVAIGACAIEKHFTLSRDEKGPDSEFSIEPSELKVFVNESISAWQSLGGDSFQRPIAESDSKIFRRSIYFVTDLMPGDKITPDSIRRIRPGFGLSPKHYKALIGMTVIKEVKRGDPVSWDYLSN